MLKILVCFDQEILVKSENFSEEICPYADANHYNAHW